MEGMWENLYWPLSKTLYKAPYPRSVHNRKETYNLQVFSVTKVAADWPEGPVSRPDFPLQKQMSLGQAKVNIVNQRGYS